MPPSKRFSKPVVAALDAAPILGIRGGTAPHRFTGVWVVVTDGRVFVRSWNGKPTGWHRALHAAGRGAIQVGGRELVVRPRKVRGARLMGTINDAYAAKYHTPASMKWVRGFARSAKRLATTTELLPV